MLRPNLSVAEAFQIIARACVRHFRLNEPLLIASRSAEPLHQARVAIRRLRCGAILVRAYSDGQRIHSGSNAACATYRINSGRLAIWMSISPTSRCGTLTKAVNYLRSH